MAKAKVVHSDDAVTVIFQGNPTTPEPSTAIIKFPGGHVEVCRTSDNRYWAHVEVSNPENIDRSRIDYNQEGHELCGIPAIPHADKIKHLALLVSTAATKVLLNEGA